MTNVFLFCLCDTPRENQQCAVDSMFTLVQNVPMFTLVQNLQSMLVVFFHVVAGLAWKSRIDVLRIGRSCFNRRWLRNRDRWHFYSSFFFLGVFVFCSHIDFLRDLSWLCRLSKMATITAIPGSISRLNYVRSVINSLYHYTFSPDPNRGLRWFDPHW